MLEWCESAIIVRILFFFLFFFWQKDFNCVSPDGRWSKTFRSRLVEYHGTDIIAYTHAELSC